MNRPLVSVITPAYNRAAFLEETILSVLNQDYPNLEYIVLDDGSTDDSARIIRKFADRITCESHDNIGETRTVNKGLSMASGEIIGVVNSDDPLLPGAISAAVSLLMTRPELLVVYPDWYVIDEQGRTMESRRTPDFSYVNMVKRHQCLPGPGTFFRKSLVDLLGGRDETFRYVADFDFWLRAGLLGPFARIPKTLATFRWHWDGTSTKCQGIAMAEEHLKIVNKLYSIPQLPDEVIAVRREAYSSAYYEAAITLASEDLSAKKHFFVKALALAPEKYVFECGKLMEPLTLILLGPKAYTSIKELYRKARRYPRKAGSEGLTVG